ncbi:MAG TPA: ABC transporter ATP-binding protein [Polyangiaceae bacterium]
MTAVTLRKVRLSFGDTVALDEVDLRVEPGELFLLVGPSGCGKTTLLRSIAGFVIPEGGAVLFGDEDVTRLPPHRRNTGMVFQSFALWPHLDVTENVAFGLRERGIGRQEIDEQVRRALESVRMGRHAARRIDQLSGGEQQRVALARALVVRPRCLLLDEPLSNLDAKLRHSMRDEIRRVCKGSGLTAVYVTHDQKEALAIADRIGVMKEGRILQVGAPAEIYRRPISRIVAGFIGETNLLEGTVAETSAKEVRVRTAAGELLAVRPDWDVRDDLKVWVSLRPECLRLAPASVGSSPPNAIAGTLDATTYLGEIAEHRLRSGNLYLRVYELNPGAASSPVDRSVVATVSPADVVLLPFDGSDA